MVHDGLNFKYFGENSIIEEPFLTNGPDNIFIGDNVRIGAYSWIQNVTEFNGVGYNPSLEIHETTSIGRFAVISANNSIKIGKNVLISERVYISDHIHEYENIKVPIINQPASIDGTTNIGDDGWLGIGCCVFPNVEIGCNFSHWVKCSCYKKYPFVFCSVWNSSQSNRKIRF